jgi:hypothetical protein
MTLNGFVFELIILEMVTIIYNMDKDFSKKTGQVEIIPACPVKSGWQDSNLRPPGPKPGAITGLRYIPNY